MTSPARARVVRCPGCGGPSLYSADNAFRPFCSARCKNNDFGAWASEGYAVPADRDADPADQPDPITDRKESPPH
jgi:endogenous inhibitor of DNA gyrase (YacG/DUF329 family)